MTILQSPTDTAVVARLIAVSLLAILAGALASVDRASAENTMVLQPDGKVAVAGVSNQPVRSCPAKGKNGKCHTFWGPRPALVRFSADGSPDSDFGAGGALVDYRASSPGLASLAYQGGDLIAAAPDYGGVRLFRYGADGAPVQEFGAVGIAEGPGGDTTLGPSTIVPLRSGSLAVGYTGPLVGKYSFGPLAAGVLSFGGDGVFGESLGEITAAPATERRSVSIADLVELGDGSVVATGSTGGPQGARGLIARLMPGSHAVDHAFGGGQGVVMVPEATSPHSGQAASAAAITREGGKLIVAGSLNGGVGVFRFGEDGEPDPSFGDAGASRLAPPLSHEASATAVAVQPDGKILIAGKTVDYQSLANPIQYQWNLLLARFNQDGSPDMSFGTDGYLRFASPNLPAPGGGTYAPGPVDLALQPDGKILLSESASGTYTPRFVLARYTATGAPDTTFAPAGYVSTIPCDGTLRQRRTTGCLSRLRAKIALSGFRSGHPHGHLSLSAANPLDPIAAVRIMLPPALRGRPGAAGKLRVKPNPSHSARKSIRRGAILLTRMGQPSALRIGLGSGALRVARPVSRSQRIFVRVEVRLADGSVQTVRLKAY